MGAWGYVKDTQGNPVSGFVEIPSMDWHIHNDPETGDYFLILTPANYYITFVPHACGVGCPGDTRLYYLYICHGRSIKWESNFLVCLQAGHKVNLHGRQGFENSLHHLLQKN